MQSRPRRDSRKIKVRNLKVDKKISKGKVKCSPEELKVKGLEEFTQWSLDQLKNGYLWILKGH